LQGKIKKINKKTMDPWRRYTGYLFQWQTQSTVTSSKYSQEKKYYFHDCTTKSTSVIRLI